jgi:hypothetical protein
MSRGRGEGGPIIIELPRDAPSRPGGRVEQLEDGPDTSELNN